MHGATIKPFAIVYIHMVTYFPARKVGNFKLNVMFVHFSFSMYATSKWEEKNT